MINFILMLINGSSYNYSDSRKKTNKNKGFFCCILATILIFFKLIELRFVFKRKSRVIMDCYITKN